MTADEFITNLSGLPLVPVLNIRETQDVRNAIKKPAPPCWVYGNPVVGLASGYRPVAINTEPIQSAVLILADVGKEKDGKPVDLATLPKDQQDKVLAKLKTITCYGMKSGVTTSLVKAQGLCGNIVEVMPTAGLGQSGTTGGEHRIEQFAGVLLDTAALEVAGMHRNLGHPDDALVGVDDDGLGTRGALIDGQHRGTRVWRGRVHGGAQCIPRSVDPRFIRSSGRPVDPGRHRRTG